MLHIRTSATQPDTKDAADSELDANNISGADIAGTSSTADASAAAGSTGAPDIVGAIGMAGATHAAKMAATATAASAATTATAASAAVSNASVTEVNSDTDNLNPAFRARLSRVVNRMHDEFGHDVEIVEGFRPQTRQNFLYEQGRTRPGDVVTWTKSSKHTMGLAADLKIDGSYDNAEAYKQLAQIAAQEGLRTLGARDPGHVELPSRGGASAWGAGADAVRTDANVSRALGLALTEGAVLGGQSGSPALPQNTDSSGDTFTLNGLLSRVAQNRGAIPVNASGSQFSGSSGNGGSGGFAGFAHQRDTQMQGVDTASVAQPAQVANIAQIAQVAHVANVAHVAAPPINGGMPGAGAPIGVTPNTSAERVGRLLDARDATPAQPLSHVTLDLDNATGGMDRITVQLRGGSVDTAIALGDTNRADRMSLRVGELQHALEHHGLEAGSIRVGSTGADAGAGWTPRHGGDQAATQGRQAPNYRDHRQDAADARQRSRREQQGGTQK
jgi:hypothetical protein